MRTMKKNIATDKVKQTNLKLEIDLVPKTCWYSNLRKELPKDKWDLIRKAVYKRAKNQCQVCGAENVRLEAHEIWEYENGKQILSGFVCLCKMCHSVKHWGFSQILASKGKISMKALEKHFMAVNNCDENTMKKHINDSFNEWFKRSKKEWIFDASKFPKIDEMIKLVEKYKKESKNI